MIISRSILLYSSRRIFTFPIKTIHKGKTTKYLKHYDRKFLLPKVQRRKIPVNYNLIEVFLQNRPHTTG